MELINTMSPETFSLFLLGIIVWTLPWKGYALWLSARNNHKKWFVALLILNTLAVLEIVYIFAVGRKSRSQTSKAESEI